MRKIKKPLAGHLKEIGNYGVIKEFRLKEASVLKRGEEVKASVFEEGEIVDITGFSKGKGFAGVVKRHHFRGHPATHGHKDQLRMPGSIGATDAARVFKGTRMAGRMGHEKVTLKNLEIVKVNSEKNEILVKGALPGPRNEILKIVSTGRSDFPNQVNNSLGFPAIFRGVLDVQAKTITDSMCIAAAEELAACAPDGGMNPEMILPTMDMWEVFPRVATATAMKAIEEGLARVVLSRDEIYKKAEATIRRSQEQTKAAMDQGFIAMPPEE